jgi:hypothetical protein
MFVLPPPVVTSQNGKSRVSVVLEDTCGQQELWFEVDDHYHDALPTKTMDAFVIGTLLTAMAKGRDMVVKGPMSSKLHYNLTHLLMASLKAYLPSLHIIKIHAETLVSHYPNQPTGVLAGFSGGVDSFCNYFEHTGDRAPPEYLITHLVYNNVGSHGQRGASHDYDIFDAHSSTMKKFAQQEDKPLIAVNSNLDEVIGMNFQLTHTLRNVTVALLLQKIIGKFLYPSCSQIRYTEVKPSHDIAGLDAVILPLLSTERLTCITSGAQYERSEKTVLVANMSSSWNFLDVCIEPYRAAAGKMNCSQCWKCVRTQLTLDVAGKLRNYDAVFDIAAYRRLRNLFIIDVLNSRNNHQEDLANFMHQQGYPIPWRTRLAAKLIPRFLASRIAKRLIPLLLKRPSLLRLINILIS